MTADPILADPQTCVRPPPLNLAAADRHIFATAASYTSNTVVLRTLRDVAVSTEGRLFRKMNILPDSFVVPERMKRRRAILGTLAHILTRGRPQRLQRALWASDEWSHEYFHWLTDALPRIYLAARHDPDLTLLLPSNHAGRRYIVASIPAFLKSKPIVMPRSTSARVSELVIPGHVARTGNYNETVLRAVAGTLIEKLAPAPAARPLPWRRTYISRSRGQRRRVANEGEILGVLRSHGFDIHYFEELSFADQVRLMTETSHLVSSHGAGLTNMMFMPKGSSVLELRRADDPNNCFYTLAACARVGYFYQLCPAVDPAQSFFVGDIVVDPAQLDRNLGLQVGLPR